MSTMLLNCKCLLKRIEREVKLNNRVSIYSVCDGIALRVEVVISGKHCVHEKIISSKSLLRINDDSILVDDFIYKTNKQFELLSLKLEQR
jgi:hypothetical protein